VVAVAIISLLGAGTFLSKYQDWSRLFRQHSDEAAITTAFEQHVTYQPEAPSPWCNTLLVDGTTLISYRTTLVPAGIGVSFYSSIDQLALPVKSQYLFLTDEEYHAIKDHLRVERLAVTPGGTLYRNLDSGCD
jgi:hypothetical protein